MRALFVGAGAVGQVYGLYLQRAGVELGFLVRPKYADEARAGFTMYPLNRPERGTSVRLDGFEVYDDQAVAMQQPWDQIWLAVSGPAIEGAWLDELAKAMRPETVLISLQPGPEGKQRIEGLGLPAKQVVFGIIAFIAYQAPLPGETRIPGSGVAWWLPPGPSPFAGDPEAVRAVVDALRRGGCPAAADADLAPKVHFGTPLLQVIIAALESAGWSWASARQGEWLRLATQAFREAVAIAGHELGQKPPFWTRLISPLAMRGAMVTTPWLIPIDLETYLAYHFTKVGDQTRAHLDHWIGRGQVHAMPTTALTTLREAMDRGPEHIGSAAAHAKKA